MACKAGILKSKMGKVAHGVVHSINQLTSSIGFFLIFQWSFKRDKSTINLLNIWLQLFIFAGYLIHVIDDVVFSSAKTHLPTDNLIVAIRLPRTFLKTSRASFWATSHKDLSCPWATLPILDFRIPGQHFSIRFN
jgi:hypothetical protein